LDVTGRWDLNLAPVHGRRFCQQWRVTAMKLENFINLDILLSPINWLIIIGIAAMVPFGVALIASPPKNPTVL
jgi:hypothetical protein